MVLARTDKVIGRVRVLLRCMSPLLAPLRQAYGHQKCLHVGVDRKWSARGRNDASDPERNAASRQSRASPQSPTCRLTINAREWREQKDRRSARLVQCRLHALRRICVADQSPGCLDRKPITAALNPAGSRTGPSWLTVGRTICNAPGTHLLIASLIITNDVCVFSPRMTSVGWNSSACRM